MQDPQLTHHIQLAILRKMLAKPSVRYSELKPADLEGNLFMYHMKQLIRLDLIKKDGARYVLTRAGKRFADRATLESMKIRIQPKILTILTVRRADGQWLLLKRKHQPFLNYVGFPSGKIHYGESLLEAATRELQEKAGLSKIALTLRGNVIMRFMDDQETVNHIIGYVFYGELSESVSVDFQQEHYDCYFAPEAALFAEPCFKGHQQIMEYLNRNSAVFVEESDYVSDY